MFVRETLIKVSLASGITFALLVGVSAAAAAQTATVIGHRQVEDIPTERVSYADLNLASSSGEKTLVTRVRGAVRRVCADQVAPLPFYECRNYAWNGAKPQIDRALARARQFAENGTSALPPVAILITAPQR